jgi:hypothetical protein
VTGCPPVVLLLYRRPELAQRVVERVAAARPPTLLVVADGPRSIEERAQCEKSLDVVRQHSWPGRVLWNVADSNLGLRRRVASGIGWALSQVDAAVILEDDCVPEPSFFTYCDSLLRRYRNAECVMHVAGASLTAGKVESPESYYFSRYCHPWGWATWRRAWSRFDLSMAAWPEMKRRGRLPFENWVERRFWTTVFDRTRAGEFDTWDYQWFFAMVGASGLSTVPRVNLIRNIGFGPGGTHYTDDHPFANLPSGSLPRVHHPLNIVHDVAADRAEFRAVGHPLLRLIRVELGRLRHYRRRKMLSRST